MTISSAVTARHGGPNVSSPTLARRAPCGSRSTKYMRGSAGFGMARVGSAEHGVLGAAGTQRGPHVAAAPLSFRPSETVATPWRPRPIARALLQSEIAAAPLLQRNDRQSATPNGGSRAGYKSHPMRMATGMAERPLELGNWCDVAHSPLPVQADNRVTAAMVGTATEPLASRPPVYRRPPTPPS